MHLSTRCNILRLHFQLTCFAGGIDPCHLPLHQADIFGSLHTVQKILIASCHPQVYIENRNLRRGQQLGHVERMLQRGRAADRRTVRQVVPVARSGTLHKGDGAWRHVIRRSPERSPVRTGYREQPFELDVGDNIGRLAVCQSGNFSRIKTLPSGGHDHGMHCEGLLLRRRLQVDRLIAAGLHTFAAGGPFAGFSIDLIFSGERQRLRQVDRPGDPHVVVEAVGTLFRADRRAIAAGGTAVVHHLGGGDHLHLHVSARSLDAFHFGMGHDPDPAVVDQPPEIDLHATCRRTELREVIVQLHHVPAQVGVAFKEDHLPARLRQFNR